MKPAKGSCFVATACCAALLWCLPADAARTPEMTATGAIFDAGKPDATDGFTAKSSMIAPNADPAGLKVSWAAGAEYPGITFAAPAAGWDFSAYSGIEARLYNPGTAPLIVNIRVDNDNGGDWSKATYDMQHVSVPVGQSAVLPIKFGESWGHPGYKLDPAHVVRVLIFAGGPEGAFIVQGVKAVTTVSPAVPIPAPAAKPETPENIVPKTLPANSEHDKTVKAQTVGSGDVASPAVGPPPAYQYGDGFVLVKNWKFGKSGTIKNIQDMSANFQYHDQFNTLANPNYGAYIVAPDAASALPKQPIEGDATGGKPVRTFLADSLKTFVVPLNGATTITAAEHNAGSGSFAAKWMPPNGGSLLGKDLLWETRVRYVTPPYFWFALWTAGDQWNHGAEMDLVESFGYDNGNNYTNYDGRYWHVGSVGGTDSAKYRSWGKTMAAYGIPSFDAAQWHTWSWLYRKDDTYECYIDGRLCQSGKLIWTLKALPDGKPLNMTFLFDGTWGSPTVKNDDFPLPAAALDNTFYEWDYSRVYLR